MYADLAEGDWQQLSAEPDSKGERWYDWQCQVLAEGADANKGYYLLFRRACAQPQKWQAYLVWSPPACDLPTLVWIAGSRWRIESAFELAKQEVVLDEYEVRNARGWDRHMILSLWALALLSVVRAASLPPPDPQKSARDRAAWPGADRAGDPAAVAASGLARRDGPRAGVGLVVLVPASSVGGPALPLPPAAGHHPMNYHCSTRSRFLRSALS